LTVPTDDERRVLARVLRQRVESLGRAGVAGLPMPSGLPAPMLTARPSTVRNPEQLVEPPVRPASVPVAVPVPPPRSPVAASPPVARPAIPPPVAASLFEEPALDVVIPASERPALLEVLAAEVARCVRCPHLASTRTQTVFGEGPPTARLMFVGEAPGADEDQTGRPFVGRAGALLTDMITKGMGLSREEVYIASVLKSRPPENRTPLPDEVAHCLPYLERQIEIVRPEFLCLLGKTAASALLETAMPLGRLRGKWHRYRKIPTIVTYHPSALLRNPAWKRDTWEDLQTLMNAMGLKAPGRKRNE
jgi:uracil-DNA glycosylase family 4